MFCVEVYEINSEHFFSQQTSYNSSYLGFKKIHFPLAQMFYCRVCVCVDDCLRERHLQKKFLKIGFCGPSLFHNHSTTVVTVTSDCLTSTMADLPFL